MSNAGAPGGYPGEVRYVEMEGNASWTVYVRSADGFWMPVDLGGPGYLTDMSIERKNWTGRNE